MLETRPRLREGAAELAPDADLGRARAWLTTYEPASPEQRRLRREIETFLDRHPHNAHLRSCLPGHLTASALLTDPDLERVLLLHHRKLGRWLQPGGHCDGDANLLGVAWREASEESGIEGLEAVPRILDLDIHEIPARPGEPAHRHLDCRFLVVAPTGAEPVGNAESRDVRWFEKAEALEVCDDASLLRLLELLP